MLRYWCHVGHAFTADAVLSAQGEEIEKLRGRLHRPHQERAGRTRRMADQKRVRNMDKLASHPETRAREYEDDASLMRGALRSGVASSAVARLSSKWT